MSIREGRARQGKGGRWKEAAEAGCAPPVLLDATNEKALDVVSLADLEYHALVTD